MNNPEDIQQWRKARRSELLALRSAVTRAQHRAWTETMTRLLVQGFPLLKSMTIGFYWPFKGEFDPRFAIRHFRKNGAIVALPEVVRKRTPLLFRAWWPGVSVVKGVFDLPVPDGTAVVRPQALLIPPVGFDVQGYRLGYGGGYFDRTLAFMNPQPLRIGVAFELSKLATIHPQSHDIAMDFIVTETGIYAVGKEGLELIADPQRAAERASALIIARNTGAAEGNSGVADDEADHDRAPRQYASSPCYAHEFNYWQEDQAETPDKS
jgi:5-formyltetrahydrofolate cyclo-ligase